MDDSGEGCTKRTMIHLKKAGEMSCSGIEPVAVDFAQD